jgi:hypothetical protein
MRLEEIYTSCLERSKHPDLSPGGLFKGLMNDRLPVLMFLFCHQLKVKKKAFSSHSWHYLRGISMATKHVHHPSQSLLHHWIP